MPRRSAIEAALAAAGAALAGVRVYDVRHPVAPAVDGDCLFVGLRGPADLARLRQALARHYPAGHALIAVSRPGRREQRAQRLTVATLERAGELAPPVSVFALAPAPEQRATVEGLRGIMARLRAPDGCPWDREQDHRALRGCLLEEAHEALEAIDRQQWQELAGELGDLLLQVLFHAQLAAERGEFDFDDVVARLREKLVARHPHVFGDAVARDAHAVLRRWDELKRAERAEAAPAGHLLAGVAPTLPALDRAQKVQRRAANVGFDWQSIEGPLAKLAEEMEELRAALAQEPPGAPALEAEVGDVLFAAVNVARFAGVDAEQALRGAVERFVGRFTAMERMASEKGQALAGMNLEQMDALWECAKARPQDRQL